MLKQLARTALVALPLVFASGAWAQSGGEGAEMSVEPLPVRTMLVPDGATTMERQFFGRITARDTVSLAFEVGGQIAVLNAPEGTRVAAGNLVAALDLGPFERRVERAELSLDQARRALDRAQALAAKNVASEVRAEEAQTAFDLAEVELRDAHAAMEDAKIIAPFDAQIADRIASQHAITEPGQPIVRLHDLSEMRVEFDLPERLLREAGDLARVTFTGHLPGQSSDMPLQFREFRAETGEIGQSYVISLAIEGEAAQSLLPGQTMIVRGAIERPASDPIVPATAIATAADGTQYVVLVEDNDGLRARHVPVTVAAPSGSGLTISELTPGSEIVEVGAHAVPDGAPLKRFVGLSRTGS